MKINTDGVLLGAMVAADLPGRILEVGTGTGVISLMLAQRFPSATIDAIEIDTLAADNARRNFAGSPFAAQLTSHAVPLVGFKATAPYDLIVSNPPFFLRSLQNNDKRKRVARHTDMAFFDELLTRSERWLGATGRLQVILPPDLADVISRKAACVYGFSIARSIIIRSFASHPPIRRIVSLARSRDVVVDDVEHEFIIYERRGVYSTAYRELLKPFFLAL